MESTRLTFLTLMLLTTTLHVFRSIGSKGVDMKSGILRSAAWSLSFVSLVAMQSLAQDSAKFRIDVAGIPKSFKELCERAEFVVDARVVSVFPTSVPSGKTGKLGPLDLETDVVISVNRVIKGTVAGADLVVGQLGGIKEGTERVPTQYALMQPGERYILFLRNPPQLSSPHASRPGYQRLDIVAQFAGLVKVENGKLTVSSGMPSEFKASIEGKTSDEIIPEILNFIKR
jgi:hypothetical protein